MYQMIVENARIYLNVPPEDLPNSKKVDSKNRGKPRDQAAGRQNPDDTCFRCGSKDHWIRDCPQPEQPKQQPPKPSGSGIKTIPGTTRTSRSKPLRISPHNKKGDSKGKGKDTTKKTWTEEI